MTRKGRTTKVKRGGHGVASPRERPDARAPCDAPKQLFTWSRPDGGFGSMTARCATV